MKSLFFVVGVPLLNYHALGNNFQAGTTPHPTDGQTPVQKDGPSDATTAFTPRGTQALEECQQRLCRQVVDTLGTGPISHTRHTASRTGVNSMAVVFWQPTSAQPQSFLNSRVALAPTSAYDNVSTLMLACNAVAA
jgi:hypothetical protein